MNNIRFWLKSNLGLIILIFVTLSVAAILYGLSVSVERSSIGYEVADIDSPIDASIVEIYGSDILSDAYFEHISGRILNSIYAEHYQKTGLLERSAHYKTPLKKQSDSTYAFSIEFLPSKTTYDSTFTVTDIKENGFTISTEESK